MGMRVESDVLAAIEELERDEIDDLVDRQLQQESSGYDHCVNQQTCQHCGDDRHSLPIKQRMREMRQLWHSAIHYYEDQSPARREAVAQLDAYRYDRDDSPVICPGSDFIGPWATQHQVDLYRHEAEQRRERERKIAEYLAGDPSYERLRDAVEGGAYVGSFEALGCFYAGLPLPSLEADTSDWFSVPFGPFARHPAPAYTLWTRADPGLGYLSWLMSAPNPFLPENDGLTLTTRHWLPGDTAPVLPPARWWRIVDSNPNVHIDIRTERDTEEVGRRHVIRSERRTMTVTDRSAGRSESFDLLTDRSTDTHLVEHRTPDGNMLDVFLHYPPSIGTWVPVEPDAPVSIPPMGASDSAFPNRFELPDLAGFQELGYIDEAHPIQFRANTEEFERMGFQPYFSLSQPTLVLDQRLHLNQWQIQAAQSVAEALNLATDNLLRAASEASDTPEESRPSRRQRRGSDNRQAPMWTRNFHNRGRNRQ